MAEVKQVKTVCRNCHGGCGVIAHVMGGKVVKVEGDPDSPISHGSMCAKGLAVTQMAYHPDRILHPMKKNSGDWQRISWDEALDTVAGKFKEAQDVFTGVVALVPHSEIPLLGLGNLFFAQGKFSQALKQHQEALKINPDSALAQAHVGEALLFMNKAKDGVAALQKAIEMDEEGLATDFAQALLQLHEEEGIGT